eukprot:TRINITY_DN324_c0_g1_i3.p1 TRINITY_DN324_c0_g1~~TRINITY_DN324_c0_g1_i3.p1  ORF type:complete len:485 (-),score=107.07 TRINITY_DN324_c0_g1_i3:23-1477(-)
MNECLTQIILLNCVNSGQSLIHSVPIIAQASLVAILHLLIGTEVGSALVEEIAIKFEELYLQQKSMECSNLLILLTHFYNFQVVHCVLIYDLIKILLNRFKELDLELLLLLLKNCGFQLRSDDPSALKEIVLIVQKQVTDHGIDISETKKSKEEGDEDQKNFNFRARFLIQMIFDLKNNKVKNNHGEDSPVVRLKKIMKGYLSKRGNPSESPLRVPWKDLLDSKEKGKWWITGSAWAGGGALTSPTPSKSSSTSFDATLMAMARSQRMNTDVRRNIFCILMSSDDYLDAFEKIQKLNLQNKQEREIISVLLHCCAQEKSYNPYYFHLATKFCTYNKNYRFTIQFLLWDKFKMLSTLSLRGIGNLASLTANLIANHSLTLGALKIVEFHKLDSHSVLFIRLLFTTLLTEYDESVLIACLEKILSAKDPQTIVGLKEGICHFMIQEELHQSNSTSSKNPEKAKLYLKRIRLVRKALEKSIRQEVFI